MDKKLSGGIFIIVVCLGLYFILKQNKNTAIVKIHTIEEKNNVYEIHAEFPEFSRADKDFNNKIRDTILGSIENFKKEATQKIEINTAKLNEAPVYSYTAGWTSDQVNNKIISFVQNVSFYVGGAHGGRELHTFSYDLKKEQEIALDDVFSGSSRYLDRVSQFAVNDLKSQISLQTGTEANVEMIRDGAAPDMKNYSKFTLGPGEMITFYFEEYQVAPYAAGEQKVIMPVSFIRSQKTSD